MQPPAIPGLTVDRSSAQVRHDPELERAVLGAAADTGATFGIAIKELSSGRGLLVNPSKEFYAASLFKLPVMYEVFNQRFLGKLGLDEALSITPRHLEFDLGTLDRGEGDRYSAGQALERMITISDNTSAIMLQDRIGAWRANQSMQALGMKHTFVLNERLTTAPADMLLLFERMARGELIDRAASAGMLHLLLRQQVNDRLPALLPKSTRVAHKTGNWDGNVHDAGIIYAPAATLVVAVLTEDVTNVKATTDTIARIGRIAFDHFEARSTRPIPIPPEPGLSYPRFTPFTPTPTRTDEPDDLTPPPTSTASRAGATPLTRPTADEAATTPTREVQRTPQPAPTRPSSRVP